MRSARTVEINKKRREERLLQAISITSEQAGFPWAAQAARLTRRVDGRAPETVYLLTSASPARLSAASWLALNRAHWSVEVMHYKVDLSHDEDRSRVAQPNAFLLLSIFRRWSNSLCMHWLSQRPNPKHKTTTDFFTAMDRDQHRRALHSVLARQPSFQTKS